MRAETLAESLWTGPMGARASAAGSAGFSNFNVTAMPGATLTLDWNFGELRLESTPLASLSTIEHMVSITLDSHAEPGGTPRALSGGFSAVTRDGETHWTALDFPGSTAISDWLAALTENDISPFTSPLKGPSLTLPLVTGGPGPSPAPRDLTIAVDVRHQGYSIEAPLAPVKPVAERAGSLDTGAMTHWDAALQRLSFDRLPLNLLLDARGSPMADQRNPDPLSDAYLEIDPLVYTGAFDAGGHFVGTGEVRLVAANGEILFEVPLSGLAYDGRLYELESFNLFGPLLGATPLTGSESQWLSAFFRRVNGDTFYLPELFIDIGIPAEPASDGSRWSADFTSPVSASLSFAGPQPVSLPGSSALVLIGLLFLARTRSTRRKCPRPD